MYKDLSTTKKQTKENCPMYNSIIQFIEKDTKKIEKVVAQHLLSGNMIRFEEEFLDTIVEFGRTLYQEILENIESTIRESEFRKQNYYVEHKSDVRTLLTRFGNIEIRRAYYTTKAGGKGVYLLAKYVGMDANDKVSPAALTSALREEVETSYRKAGEEACLTKDVITKQTVKKVIHHLEVEMPEEIPEQKTRIMFPYSFMSRRAICPKENREEKIIRLCQN